MEGFKWIALGVPDNHRDSAENGERSGRPASLARSAASPCVYGEERHTTLTLSRWLHMFQAGVQGHLCKGVQYHTPDSKPSA